MSLPAVKDTRERNGYDSQELSVASLKIGKILLTEREAQHWSSEISRRTSLNRPAVHRILKNFERQGWAVIEYERINSADHKRARVLFSLTMIGVVAMRDALIPFQHAPVST